jgi:hypothetical protein
MQKLNDLSRCLTSLQPDGTLIAVIEMSLSSWLVAGIVPGVERQPLKKLAVDENALLKLLHRWRDEAEKAGHKITRITVAFEVGRDGFWLATADPRRRELGAVKAAPVKDALRSGHKLDDGPVAMQLDEPAALDGPNEAAGAEICAGAIAVTAEQGQRVPTQFGSAPSPVFGRDNELVAVDHELAPSVRQDVNRPMMIVETGNPMGPIRWNLEAFRYVRRILFNESWFLSFRTSTAVRRRSDWWLRGRIGDRCGGLRQRPCPLARVSKSGPKRSYSEGLLGPLECFCVGHVLLVAEQTRRSSLRLQFGDA